MANLKELQERLNSDTKFRDDFLVDPVGVLNKEGIILSPEMEEELAKSIKDLTSAPKTTAGASVRSEGGISISISKSF